MNSGSVALTCSTAQISVALMSPSRSLTQVLDMCAAPGSKTAQLLEALQQGTSYTNPPSEPPVLLVIVVAGCVCCARRDLIAVCVPVRCDPRCSCTLLVCCPRARHEG